VDSIEGCFLLYYTQATTWTEAQYQCEMVGGFLAEPQTKEQMDLLTSLAYLEQSILGMKSWWIGLTDQSHEGRWIWQHSMTDLTYTAWSPSAPQPGINPTDCAVMDSKDGFLWSDTDCSHSIAAPICQREQGEEPTTTTARPSTTTSPEHHIELRGGHVYSNEATGNVFATNRNGYLGPVCDDSWGSLDARVVCHQLGYRYGIAYSGSHWGSVPSTFAMDNVGCGGSEDFLQECTYSTSDDCGSSEGAGVQCYNEDYSTTEKPYSTTSNW